MQIFHLRTVSHERLVRARMTVTKGTLKVLWLSIHESIIDRPMKISRSDTLPKTSIVLKVAYTPLILLVVVSTKQSAASKSNTVDRDALEFYFSVIGMEIMSTFQILDGSRSLQNVLWRSSRRMHIQYTTLSSEWPACQNRHVVLTASSVVLQDRK